MTQAKPYESRKEMVGARLLPHSYAPEVLVQVQEYIDRLEATVDETLRLMVAALADYPTPLPGPVRDALIHIGRFKP